VEAFHRHGHLAQIVGQGRIGLAAERLVGRHREERPPTLAGTHQPIPGDELGLPLGRSQDEFHRARGEPEVDLVAQPTQIQSAGAVVGGEVDVFPDPVEIDVGVDAVVLQQGHGDSGDRRGLHVGEGPFQHAQAADADDGLDLARLDEAHDDGRTLGHQHGVPQLLGFDCEVLDRA